MEKKIIRLTESDLHRIIKESVNRILKEYNGVNDEWYQEEDYDGHVGENGMIRSYDIGAYYVSQAEEEAKENGFNNVADYLKYWFSEIKSECPWYWQKVNSTYGRFGDIIFREGGVVCKDISDQIIIDEFPIGDASYNADFDERLNKGEYWMK